MSSAVPPIDIDVRSVKSMLEAQTPMLLIDCREPSEFQLAHIEGARLMPIKTVPDRLAELEPYRNQPIVVHCHHGGRSLRLTHWLRQQGFTSVQNMAGGIDAWSVEIDPAVPRY